MMKSVILAGTIVLATVTGAYATKYYVYAPSSGGCQVIDDAGTPSANRMMKFEGKAFDSQDAANALAPGDVVRKAAKPASRQLRRAPRMSQIKAI